MKKRDFIVVAGSSAAVCLACAAPTFAAPDIAPVPRRAARSRRPPGLDGTARQATWQRYVGEDFVVEAGDMAGVASGPTLRLLRIESAASPRPGLDQFTLVFDALAPPAAPSRPVPDTGTWQLRHRTGQRVKLYLDAPATAAGPAPLRAHFSLLA